MIRDHLSPKMSKRLTNAQVERLYLMVVNLNYLFQHLYLSPLVSLKF